MKLVTVIIPVYNVEQYLEECIESVLRQTYTNIEIILVDDGSSDKSGKICDTYAQKHTNIKVFHKINGGLSSARNYGLTNATGEYIYFLDSDDYIADETIQELLNVAEKNDLDILFFGAESFIDGDNEIVKGLDLPYENLKTKIECVSGRGYFRSSLEKGEYFPCVPFQLIKHDFIIQNGLHFRENMIHEDELFTLMELNCSKRVGRVPNKYYKRRIRKGSIMTTSSPKKMRGFYECLKTISNLYFNCRKENEDYEFFDRALKYLYEGYQYRFCQLEKDQRKELAREFGDTKKSILGDNRYKKLPQFFKRVKSTSFYMIKSRLRENKVLNTIYNKLRNR